MNDANQYGFNHINDSVNYDLIEGQEIWNVVSTPFWIFFQSLKRLFRYYEGRIETIILDDNNQVKPW